MVRDLPMPGLLFVHSSHKDLRRAFRREGRVDWSASLPLVLEKHGYLGVASRPWSVLRDRSAWTEFDGIVIARQADEAWRPELVEALAEGPRPVLIEGPVPQPLRDALGIRTAEPADPEGVLAATDPGLAGAAASFGASRTGRLGSPTARHVPRDPSMDWRVLDVPVTEPQADAWNRRGWVAERWAVDPGTEVLAEWRPAQSGPRSPAIVRRGHLIATALSLFAALTQAHTAEPWSGEEFRSSPRSLGVEFLLLALLDEMYRSAGLVRPRVLPWPRGGRWAMNVRHDFDRPLPPFRVADALARHNAAGTAATWYWRSRHLRWRRGQLRQRVRPALNRKALRLVAAHPRMEVAHHTERPWAGAEKERRAIERVVGQPILGTSAHGDPSCFRFQGAPNLLWAEQQRLLYTEFLERSHYGLHRFATLRPDGVVAPLRVLCLPHHESLDRSIDPESADEARIATAAEAFSSVGGFLQVMNHPDINLDALFRVISELPAEGRLDWTAARAADWWRRSHVRDHLQVESLERGAFRITSSLGVQDLALELLYPSGERRTRIVTLGEEATTVVSTRLVGDSA